MFDDDSDAVGLGIRPKRKEGPSGLGISPDEYRLWRLWGDNPSFEVHRKRLSNLETIALFHEVDTRTKNWISELMFKLALEHPHISKKKRKNGRPKSLYKFANDRSVLKFAFKLRGMMSRAQGREVSFRKVARNIAVLDLMREKKLAIEEAWKSFELEDRTTKFAKRLATLRKEHPDVEADSKKPTQLSGTDSRASE